MVSNAGFLSIKFVDGTQLLIDQLADQHYYSFSLHATMEGYGFYENSVSLWTCVLLSGRLSSYNVLSFTLYHVLRFVFFPARWNLDFRRLHGCDGTNNAGVQSPCRSQRSRNFSII
jgi:hypothetical protein